MRWLRAEQVIGRVRHKIVSPRVSASFAVSRRPVAANWNLGARRTASLTHDGIPVFLNTKGTLVDPSDWNDPAVSRLWLYNLHYFDDLNAEDASERAALHRELIQRWIDENPAPIGTGWEPYPCSLRIVNWIKWALSGNDMCPEWQSSLAVQTDWLSKNLEWHLLGNHLFANAKALVFAALFFEGPSAEGWLNSGLGILERELPEQVLADGGQFERSPMYHAIALEDLIDLINLAECFEGSIKTSVIVHWRETATKMLRWAAVMQHPDEEISLFNDSAFGIAPAPSELSDYAGRLGLELPPAASAGLKILEDSGYVRAEAGDAVLLADVGEIGPDYLPGHSHADTLSFELSLYGDRWFVDTGCSTYEVGEERLRQRSTAAHNTVTVDGQDSSEVWSSFRVARRARPINVDYTTVADSFTVSGAHDGYKRLKGRATHSRVFQLTASRLDISDFLDGQFDSAVANFLLHPEVEVDESGEAIVLRRGAYLARLAFLGGRPEIQTATWHPEFGISIATRKITVRFFGAELAMTLTWNRE